MLFWKIQVGTYFLQQIQNFTYYFLFVLLIACKNVKYYIIINNLWLHTRRNRLLPKWGHFSKGHQVRQDLYTAVTGHLRLTRINPGLKPETIHSYMRGSFSLPDEVNLHIGVSKLNSNHKNDYSYSSFKITANSLNV